MTSVFIYRFAGDIHALRFGIWVTSNHRSRTRLSSFQRRINSHRSTSISTTRYYDVLGLTPRATQKQIKSAYYDMSKLYHPDVATGKRSHAMFTEINEAYEVLGNLRKRRMYDRGVYTKECHQENTPDMDKDYTAAYKSKQSPFERGERPPPPQGRSNIYNFDEFYRQHYNEIRERRSAEYREFVQHQDRMQRKGNQFRQDGQVQGTLLTISIFVCGFVLLSTIAISRENYDKDMIGFSRSGSSHPNYYGAKDPLANSRSQISGSSHLNNYEAVDPLANIPTQKSQSVYEEVIVNK